MRISARRITALAALLLGLACARAGEAQRAAADLPAARRSVHVRSLLELQIALDAALPGDHVVLADGVYRSRDAIRVERSGERGAPIVVRAETVGGAEIGGAAGFELEGADRVVIYGFRFTHDAMQSIPAGADHVRLARNTFELGDSVRHWLQLSGDDAEVDHNTFQNKSTLGVYLAIDGPSDRNAQRAHVHHNFFHNHQFTGSNGGESIRAGLSWRSLWPAGSLIENNLFEQADGDPEAISNKASDNVIRHNTIRDSKGCIVLRHGNRVTVAGNFILDSGCGIRAYGNEHQVHDNYVAGARGAALTIGSGMFRDHLMEHTPQQRQGYDAAERMRIASNTFVRSAAGIVGEEREHAPRDNLVANNIVQVDGGRVVAFPGNAPVDFRWEGNLFWGNEIPANVPRPGFAFEDPRLVPDDRGLLRPGPGSPAIDEGAGAPRDLRPLTRADVGPAAP